MTETPESPQDGMAGALHNLSEQTRVLARREIDSAIREMWAKARQSWPAAALLAASGVFGLAAAASSYRLSLRLLERRLPPAAAAFAATVGYGAAAAAAAVLGARRIRDLPPPLPVETAREAGQAVSGAAAQAVSGAAAQADSGSSQAPGARPAPG